MIPDLTAPKAHVPPTLLQWLFISRLCSSYYRYKSIIQMYKFCHVT